MSTIFSATGKQFVTTISYILRYTSSEFINDLILAFMSIYTLGRPLIVLHNFAEFIAVRMHEQFTRMSNERVFKYSFVLYHMFLYYQPNIFPFTLQKLDTKGQPRSAIFWTPLFHKFGSPYNYSDL